MLAIATYDLIKSPVDASVFTPINSSSFNAMKDVSKSQSLNDLFRRTLFKNLMFVGKPTTL